MAQQPMGEQPKQAYLREKDQPLVPQFIEQA